MYNILKVFPHGKTKAFTMSFDDGKITDKKFIDIINKYNLKCTFNINTGLMGTDEGFGLRNTSNELLDLYQNHEIASHSLLHPTLPRCPKEHLIFQLFEDRKNLENILKKTVRGLAYPNKDGINSSIKELLPKLGFVYGRSTEVTNNFNMPQDFYEWKCTSYCLDNITSLAKEFISLKQPQYLSLFSIYGHSIDFEKTDSWETFELFCKQIAGDKDIWYVTNIGFVDYNNAWNQLRFSATNLFVENPTAITCWVVANNKLYEVKSGTTVKF